MATINNMISGGANTSIIRNNQEQMNDLRNQLRNNEIDSKEFREKSLELRDQQADARMGAVQAGINTAANVSSLFSYMNNSSANGAPSMWGGGTFDSSVFINSGAELSTLQAMNSARIGIENRARSLVGEIGRDRARGIDVSDRQEALSNLTGNLDILNRNLSNSIDRALSDGRNDSKFIDIVGRIRESLKPTPAPETEKAAEGAAPATAAPASEAVESNIPNPAQAAEDIPQPEFAAPAQFEGSVSEQITAASEKQPSDEMSVAAQIASNAQSEYAASSNVLENTTQSAIDSVGDDS